MINESYALPKEKEKTRAELIAMKFKPRCEYEDFINVISFCERTKDPYKIISAAYKIIDPLLGSALDHSVCKTGCCWCCAVNVDITDIEANYIIKNTNVKFDLTDESITDQFCPLLDLSTGKCSVYEYRPFNCRTFTTLDNPRYCEQGGDIEHALIGHAGNLYGSHYLLTLYLIIMSASDDINDIRNYFGNSGVTPVHIK